MLPIPKVTALALNWPINVPSVTPIQTVDGVALDKEISDLVSLVTVLLLLTTALNVSLTNILVNPTVLQTLAYTELASVEAVSALVDMEDLPVTKPMTVLVSWEDPLKSMYVVSVTEMELLVSDVMELSTDLNTTLAEFAEETELLASTNVN